jgi:hypothetical protein
LVCGRGWAKGQIVLAFWLLCRQSTHVLRLGCYTIPEQSRLGVTIQRARIEWEQREADNARGHMGEREASMASV